MRSSRALVLFGHGAREPEWARPIGRIREILLAADPERQVECAFLEYLSPSLGDCVTGLCGLGATDFVILPVFIAQGGHLKRQLPEMVAALRVQHPACRFELAAAVGEAESVCVAIARHAAALAV